MSMPPPLLEVVPFDRAPVLSRGEREALAALGWQLRRRRGHDAARPEWGAIGRLLAPLDAARLALRDRRDTPLHRRSSTGRPAASITTPTIICSRSGRWSLE